MDAMLRLIPLMVSVQCFLPFAKSVYLEEPELHDVQFLQMQITIGNILGNAADPAALVVKSPWQPNTVHAHTHTYTYERAPTRIQTRSLPSIPPILYAKTHKTGSSTMAGIIHRMGDQRNLTFMLPSMNNVNLGYHGRFLWENGSFYYGLPQHQYDVICNHAVLNSALMYAYLKPRPHLIVSLREPSAQMISAKNFYQGNMSFDDYLELVSNENNLDVSLTITYGRQNMQAYDLGWYDFVGGTTGFDNDQAKIGEWLAMLDGEVDSVVLSEYFDEGLVLWRQKMHVGLEEMLYVRFKDNEAKVQPTDDQYRRIAALNNVDRALYVHFSQRFWQEWFNGTVSELEADVERLKRSNEKLQRACDEGDSEQCPPCFTMDNKDYTAHLKMKQIVH